MMEVLVVSSGKDACGLAVIDVSTGGVVCNGFKNCIAEAGTLCNIGSSSSSYSGLGSCGDFIAVAQSKKPVVHIWQWGKPQATFQCHVQEIITALVADSSGTFLFGGTKKGWIYCWNTSSGELINIWQAHFKSVTKLQVTKNGLFCVSVSEDGLGRAWDLSKVLDISEKLKRVSDKQTISPFRSWSSHTLAVKDMCLIDSVGMLRVVTCSMDRTVVMYDVLAGKQIFRMSLPHSLESITSNPGEDVLCVGSTNGTVFVVDLSVTAIGISASHSKVSGNSGSIGTSTFSLMGGNAASKSNIATVAAGRPESSSLTSGGLPSGTGLLEGHTKAVTALSFSMDNTTLVSASEDGTVRMWDIWTRQCVRECKPLSKCGVTNALMLTRPETIDTGVAKPSLCPVGHLKKYMESTSTADDHHHQPIVLGPTLLSNHDAMREGSADISSNSFRELKRRQDMTSSDLCVAAVPDESCASEQEEFSSNGLKRRRAAEQQQVAKAMDEDFISFGGTYDKSEHSHSFEDNNSDREEGVVSTLQEKLRVAEEKIALLQQQNSRWENICTRLKERVDAGEAEQLLAGKCTEEADAPQDREEEDHTVDGGDAVEVVAVARKTTRSTSSKTKVEAPSKADKEAVQAIKGGRKRKLDVENVDARDAKAHVINKTPAKTPAKKSK